MVTKGQFIYLCPERYRCLHLAVVLGRFAVLRRCGLLLQTE